MLFISKSRIQAQSMLVKEHTGTITPYDLSSINKITFSTGSLIITNTDNITEEYPLESISYLKFSDIITGTKKEKNAVIETYPNPVSDLLYIDFKGIANSGGFLSILNTDGQTLKTKEISENKLVPIDISDLPKGIYLCRYFNNSEIKTIKIIKN